MIMPRGQQLLLPASSLFIWSSLLVALGCNMLLNMGWLGRAAWLPDLLALTLVFWTIHQPLRVGMTVAFVLGLGMDVHQSALLGQHALAYAALSFLAIAMHRRLLWFSVPSQAAQVLPLFVVAHALTLLVRLIAGDDFPGWSMLLAPVLEALLWPAVSVVLLLPQKRAPNPDANRPL
ncbi:MAG: rod shape-determining protein MreD [Rhodoferax sp.]|jgi:rod shape-determining protein MreD|uniref:rod shape-determining protein MreD n=1 Tax=Rhodoferax sp. TaxID=50421 RepID=UPI003BAEAA24